MLGMSVGMAGWGMRWGDRARREGFLVFGDFMVLCGEVVCGSGFACSGMIYLFSL